MTENKHNWIGTIETISGVAFDIMEPTVDMVRLGDIAHSLSMQCRYGGHVPTFYSVAEHAVRVAWWLEMNGHPELAYEGLHHDDPEAYIGDIVRPLKHHPMLRGPIETIETPLDIVIGDAIGCDLWPMHPMVKEADYQVYLWEVDNIRTSRARGWDQREAKDTYFRCHERLRLERRLPRMNQ